MMPRRAAIAALEHAATHGGDLGEARRFLARVDPLVRARALRIVRGALADAETAVRVRGSDAPAHAARVALLALAGTPVAAEAVDDVAAVREAFDAARSGRAARRWVWPFTWALALALGAGALATVHVVRAARAPAAASKDATARAALPPAGAYAKGGVPRADATVRRALAHDVPDVFIALDEVSREAPGERRLAAISAADAARAKALSPAVMAAAGPLVASRLAALLARASDAVEAPSEGRATADEAFLVATGALDDAFAAADLGYFVDGDVITDATQGRRIVILYAFEVTHVAVYTAKGASAAGGAPVEPVRALELRRVDA
ncbi:MAG TPA: hypothetical protein VGM56_23370, partial [Byssovorax sp.]